MQRSATAVVTRMCSVLHLSVMRFCCAAAVFLFPLQVQAADLRISDASGLTRLLSAVTGPADIRITVIEGSTAKKVELESADGLGDSVRAKRRNDSVFIARRVKPGRYILKLTPPGTAIESIEIVR